MALQFPKKQPTLIGSITTVPGLALLHRSKIPSDAIELRVDALLKARVKPAEIHAALHKHQNPVMLTLRIPEEGGLMKWDLAKRRELYIQFLPSVEAIDVELASAKSLASVIKQAVVLRKTIVLSAHSIAKAATPKQLIAWLKAFEAVMEQAPGTSYILKVAAHVKTLEDLQQLAVLQVNAPEIPVAVMGLGPKASLSRTVLVALGARLVYGYLDEPAAPGQPAASDMRRYLAEHY